MPNLNWISKKYFPKLSPRLINAGDCYNWAYIAYQYYDNVKLYTIEDCGGHAFVKIGRYYFDAQHPNGVLHWSSLSLLKEVCQSNAYFLWPKKQSLKAFLWFWGKNGKNPIIDIGNNVYNRHNRKYQQR